MSTYSHTFEITHTYTRADIRRVVNEIAADLDMIAESSGVLTRDEVNDYVADLVTFAQEEYLSEVHISLRNRFGVEVRATRYCFSRAASGWQTQLPGNNLWPRTPGGTIEVGLRYSQEYRQLPLATRAQFLATLRLRVGPSGMDFNHSGLTGWLDRLYASRGFGAEKFNFA
jgi:hypothetical protein